LGLLFEISEDVRELLSSLNCRSKFFIQYKWMATSIIMRNSLDPTMNLTKKFTF